MPQALTSNRGRRTRLRHVALAFVAPALVGAALVGPAGGSSAGVVPPRTTTSTASTGHSTLRAASEGVITAGVAGRPSLPAAVDPKVGFGVVPATATGIDDRAFYSYGLAPGSVAYDHVAVVNYSAGPLTLGIGAADATSTSDGGFALAAADQPSREVGVWARVGGTKRTVRVPGRTQAGQPGRVILPVTITVPKNASPGDHAGGIITTLATVGKNPKGQDIRLEQRVASRVYIKVAGPVKPGLEVTELSATYAGGTWPWQSGSVTVSYAIVNTGNVRLGYDPAIRVSGPAGLGSRTLDLEPVDELLPHTSQTLTRTVDGVWPFVWATARVSATPQAAVAAPAPDLAQISRDAGFLALAWWLLLLLVVIVAVVVRVIRRRRSPRSGGRAAADPRVPTRVRATV